MSDHEEHVAHLQQILEHEDNDLSPNDQAALRYFIDIAGRPSFKETVCLDMMWQKLVRERDEATFALQHCRDRFREYTTDVQSHGLVVYRLASAEQHERVELKAMLEELQRYREWRSMVIDLALDAFGFANTFKDQVPECAQALQLQSLAVRDFKVDQ